MKFSELGKTSLRIPRIVFGTSCLGNLYEALPEKTKLAISREWFAHQEPPVVIDSAGKYGAGLALEMIGHNLRELEISPSRIIISNKLGWKRVPLTTPEPTFEPGAWADLQHDAVQCISYEGIFACWEQGCELLGPEYPPQMLSVHDPDEYLAAATSNADRDKRLADIIGAYRALHELKVAGKTQTIGIGSKDWRVIEEIEREVALDWVMLANSLTIYRHPPELLEFVARLVAKGIAIINSAVFHAGFLVGGKFFDYRIVSPASDPELFSWREKFLALCEKHEIRPAVACIQFGLTPPGVVAISLNTSDPTRVGYNVSAVEATLPSEFWLDAKRDRLIASDYPYC
ncbi:MAG: aldo/keto reductase [Bythopirellula sp.]|nr:aldo/keto reductase [Bythopirellula sp.]